MACFDCSASKIDEQVELAAENGHIDCMQCLREQRLTWNETTFRTAAHDGHLTCLQYLREHNCPWDEWAPAFAAMNGHLDCLKYLKEQGCPWNKCTSTLAALHNQLYCLQYIREQGCPWSFGATLLTIKIAHNTVSEEHFGICMNILCSLVNSKGPGYRNILAMPLYVEYTSSPWLK